MEGNEEPVVFEDHTDEVYYSTFSPDGKRIVSGSLDMTARVWNADGTGEALVLRGHESAVWRAAFSPDGTRVATASWDGTARVWRVTWSALLEYLRENTHACLTAEQRMQCLAETSSDAWETYAACERRHGRSPDERTASVRLN
jgi:WD40 repeat protein